MLVVSEDLGAEEGDEDEDEDEEGGVGDNGEDRDEGEGVDEGRWGGALALAIFARPSSRRRDAFEISRPLEEG